MVAAGGVQQDRAEILQDGILLHIEEEKLVHGAFKEFPDHPDRHREAEGDDGQVQRRKVEAHAAVTVEDIQQ